ncbi:MAG: tetratricopeptide repeat protein [Deltaproteobacteria bacterium]|nr:tetratricopeptide repeat protein [Deltaproteobacteria bacterium]
MLGLELEDLVPDALAGEQALSAVESPKDRVDAYERDIVALAGDPKSAPLLLAQGRIFEEQLHQLDRAAACYDRALKCDPAHVPAILAARRLQTELGNWTLVADLLEAEAKVTENAEALAAIHAELARLCEEKLNQPDRARQEYDAARKAQPGSLVHERAYFRHLLDRGDHLAAYEVLDALAADVKDAPFRAELHRTLAELAGPKLQNPEVAVAHQRAVIERDPKDVSARSAIARELRSQGNYEELAKFHSFAAQRTDDPEAAATHHYLAARVFRDHLAEEARALVELQAAIAKVPDHPLALSELVRSLEAAQRWQELVELLGKEAAATQAPEERAQKLFRIGQLHEEKLGNEAQAVTLYQEVLSIRAAFLPALQALGKLYSRTGRWKELAAMYDGEILATPDPKAKVTKLFKLAEVLELRLDERERAIAMYQQILELEEGYVPALKALTRMYQRTERWDDLIALYEQEAKSSEEPEQKISLLEKVGQIYEEKMKASDRAAQTYQRILDIAPEHLRTIRTLASLYTRTEKFEDLIRMNETEAGLINDQKQVVDLLHRNGELCEERLNDKKRAIECYKQVLTLAPNYVPALRSLGRLYLQKGRWEELADMYRQEIEVTSTPEQAAALHFKIGELHQDKLLKEEAAIQSYEKVISLVPTHRQAIMALSGLFRARGLWQRLVDILEREAEASGDATHKAARLYEAGELYEDRLKDNEQALECYVAALRASPDFDPAWTAQMRLLEELAEHTKMTALLGERLKRMKDGPAKLETALLLGGLAWARTNEHALAVEAYEAAQAIAPEDPSVLLHLERVYLQRKAHKKAIPVLEKLAQLTKDSRVAVAYQLQAAALKENVDPPEPSAQNYRAVLELDATNALALRALEVQLHHAHDVAGLDVVYQRMAGSALPSVARTMILERAELLLDSGGDVNALVPSLEALVKDDPTNLAALRVLRRAYDKVGNWQGFLQATEQEGRMVVDTTRAVRLLTDVGTVQWRKQNDTKKARASFQEAIKRDPKALPPFMALTEMLSASQDWADLAKLLEERKGDKGEFLVEAGSIYLAKLNQLDRARHCFEAALELDRDRVDTHAALGEIAQKSRDFVGAIDHYSRALGSQASGEQAAAVHVKLAEIFSRDVKDPARAANHVRAAFAANPLDPATLDIAVNVLTNVGDGAAAKSALNRIIELTDDGATKAQRMCQLGEICVRLLGDDKAAIAAYEAALQALPGLTTALEQLISLYERTGNTKRLLEVTRQLVEHTPAGEAKAKSLLHQRMAQLYAEHLKDYSLAAVEMKQAIALEPEELGLRERQALFLSMNAATMSEAVTQFRALLEKDPFRIPSLRALCRLYAQQNQHDKAFCFAEMLVFLRAADPEELNFYAQNKERVANSTDVVLSEEAYRRGLVDPEASGAAGDLIAALSGELEELYKPRRDPASYEKNEKLGPKSPDPIRTLVDSIARVIEAPELTVYLTAGDPHAVEAEVGAALIVPRDLLRRVPPKEQRFLLARALQAMKRGHAVVRRFHGVELAIFIDALALAVHSGFEPNERTADRVEALAKALRAALSRKAKKAMEAPAKAYSSDARTLDANKLIAAMERTELRAALTLTGDFETSARMIAKQAKQTLPLAFNTAAEVQEFFARVPGFSGAMTFYLSETHFALRQKLRIGIDA